MVPKIGSTLSAFFLAGISGGVGALDSNLSQCQDNVSLWEQSQYKLNKADEALNRTYRNLLDRVSASYSPAPELGESLKSHIRKAQRAWIALRDETCHIQAFFIDPAAPAFEEARLDCLARETEIRTQYLGSLQY